MQVDQGNGRRQGHLVARGEVTEDRETGEGQTCDKMI